MVTHIHVGTHYLIQSSSTNLKNENFAKKTQTIKMQKMSKLSNTSFEQEQSSTKYKQQTLQKQLKSNCHYSSTKLVSWKCHKNFMKKVQNCSNSFMTGLRDQISTQMYNQRWAIGSYIVG